MPGWQIREASNGETALRLVDDEDFDLIFLDQYMSSAEKQLLGTETARKLRSKGVAETIICGLSANDMQPNFLKAGADIFLMKPFPCKSDELKKSLLTVLQTRGKKYLGGHASERAITISFAQDNVAPKVSIALPATKAVAEEEVEKDPQSGDPVAPQPSSPSTIPSSDNVPTKPAPLWQMAAPRNGPAEEAPLEGKGGPKHNIAPLWGPVSKEKDAVASPPTVAPLWDTTTGENDDPLSKATPKPLWEPLPMTSVIPKAAPTDVSAKEAATPLWGIPTDQKKTGRSTALFSTGSSGGILEETRPPLWGNALAKAPTLPSANTTVTTTGDDKEPESLPKPAPLW